MCTTRRPIEFLVPNKWKTYIAKRQPFWRTYRRLASIAVWLDLVKFHHFGKKLFGRSFDSLFSIWQKFDPFGPIFNGIGPIFIVVRGKKLKTKFSILSHWIKERERERDQEKITRRKEERKIESRKWAFSILKSIMFLPGATPFYNQTYQTRFFPEWRLDKCPKAKSPKCICS